MYIYFKKLNVLLSSGPVPSEGNNYGKACMRGEPSVCYPALLSREIVAEQGLDEYFGGWEKGQPNEKGEFKIYFVEKNTGEKYYLCNSGSMDMMFALADENMDARFSYNEITKKLIHAQKENSPHEFTVNACIEIDTETGKDFMYLSDNLYEYIQDKECCIVEFINDLR